MTAGSEALVLKISADTTAVAAGLEPMSSALDGLKTTAAKTSEQLGALSDTSVAPTVDASDVDKLGAAVDTATEDLRSLDSAAVAPTVDTSGVDNLGESIDDTKESAEQLSRSAITIQMRREALDKAKRDIEDLKDQIAEDVQMGVSTRDSERELAALQRSVDTLTDEDHTIDVTIDDTDTSFALENLGKLRKNARAVTDAFVSLQSDGLNSLPGALSAANTSMLLLNSSIDSFIERRAAANLTTGSLVTGVGRVASFLSGPWGLAVGAGITLLGQWIGSQTKAKEATETFTGTLDEQKGAFDESNRRAIATQLQQKGMLQQASELGLSLDDLVTALYSGGQAFDDYTDHVSDLIRPNSEGSYDAASVKASEFFSSLFGLRGQIDANMQSQRLLKTAIGDTSNAASSATGLTKDQADEMERLNRAYENAIGSIKLFNGVIGDTHAKQIAVKEDFANLREIVNEVGRAVNKSRTAFDLNSKKGREAETQIDRTAAAIADLTQAQIDNAIKHGRSTDKIVANYGKQRQQLIDTAIQLGLSKTAAEKYVDELLDTPKEVKTKVTQSGAKEAKAAIDEIPENVYTTVHIVPALERFNRLPKRLQDAISGNGSVNLSMTAPPGAAPPPSAGLTLLQPRLYLDSRPIRYAIRNDVASTVASQLAATRKRGRL